MLELDLILLPFLENHYESLAEPEKISFQRLLTCQDPELFDWFMGKAIPEDPAIRGIVEVIIQQSREVTS